MVLRKPPSQNCEIKLSLVVQKFSGFIFFKEQSLLKLFHGLAYCRFENTVKNFSAEGQKNSTPTWRNFDKLWIFQKKHFPLNIFHGHEGCSFDKPAERFSTICQNFLNKSPQKLRKIFFQTNFWPQAVCFIMWNAFLTTPPDSFGTVAKNFPIDVQIWWKRFLTQLFSSQNPYGHVECSFDNPIDKKSCIFVHCQVL